MKQKINLTIEEILSMSPNFVHKLQELSEKDKEKIKSLNSMDLQERLLSFGFKKYQSPRFIMPVLWDLWKSLLERKNILSEH